MVIPTESPSLNKVFTYLLTYLLTHCKELLMNIKIIWFFTYFIPDKYMNRHSVNDFNKRPFKLWSSVQTTVADPVRSIDRLDSNVDTVPVRSIGILDSYVDTVSQSRSDFHAGVHYCNSPFKPVTGSEG